MRTTLLRRYLGKDLARKSGTASHIEDERWRPKIEELQRSMGHI
jgi:hypothetical protein